MSTVTVYSIEKMEELLDAGVVGVSITDGVLSFEKRDGTTVDGGDFLDDIPNSSDTVKGLVELATDAETATGTDSVRAVTPFSLASVLTPIKSAFYVNVKDHGVVGNGTTDDTSALNAVLSSATPGTIVYLPKGTYVTSAPLVIPPQVTLLGTHGGHIRSQVNSMIKPASGFTGAAVISMVDQTTGGYSTESCEQRIEKISIDGSNLTGTTIDAILATGAVHGVYLIDVQVRFIPNRGVAVVSNGSGSPFSWRGVRVHVSSPTGIGIIATMTDSTWSDCEVLGSGSHGWSVGGAANSAFIGCRSEWGTLNGFEFASGTGSSQGSGGPVFIGCTTDRNGQHGVNVGSGANGKAPVTFSACTFRRDGRSSTSSGYAGININGTTQPIVVDGCVVYPGVNDDGTGSNTPQYGISVASATDVQIIGGVYHAASEGVHNGGSNIRMARGVNVSERTGSTSTPTTVTRGIQTYDTNGDSLDVPGHLAGIPTPAEHHMVGWSTVPDHVAGGKAGTAGTLYLARVNVAKPASVTKLAWGINTAGVTATAGRNWVCLYDSAGTLLGSVAVDARVITTGAWLETITAVPVVPGYYYVGFLFTVATMPQVYRSSDLNATLANLNLGNNELRFATNGTGLNTPPSTITPASASPAQFTYFAGLA